MTTNEVCPDCQGGGYRDKIPLQNCPTCNGVGWMKAVAGMDALDRLSTPPAVPATPVADYVMVPREPTKEMLIAMRCASDDFYSESGEYPRSKAVYKAMIAVAPVPAHSSAATDNSKALAEIDAAIELLVREDGDRDHMNHSNITCEHSMAIVALLRYLRPHLSTTAQSGDQKETQFRKHKSTQNI